MHIVVAYVGVGQSFSTSFKTVGEIVYDESIKRELKRKPI